MRIIRVFFPLRTRERGLIQVYFRCLSDYGNTVPFFSSFQGTRIVTYLRKDSIRSNTIILTCSPPTHGETRVGFTGRKHFSKKTILSLFIKLAVYLTHERYPARSHVAIISPFRFYVLTGYPDGNSTLSTSFRCSI